MAKKPTYEELQKQISGLRGQVKSLEEKLAEKERPDRERSDGANLYRGMLENTPWLAIEIDLEGNITYANPAAFGALGYTPEDIGRNITEFIPPEDVELEKENLKRGFSGGDSVIESRVVAKDGAIHYFINNSLLLHRNGKPVGLAIFGIDVTALKRAEEARRESEEKHRSLFEQSRDAIYLSMHDGRTVDINQATVDLFGYSREENLNLNAVDTYADPRDREAFQREIEKNGSVTNYEVKLKKKDGTLMDCLLTSTLRRSNEGNIVGYQGIIRDVTEKKRTEKALADSERHYRLLIETMNDGVAVLDTGGTVTYVNDKFSELIGYKHEEITGRSIKNFIEESNMQIFRDQFASRRKGAAGSYELAFRKKGGGSVSAIVSAKPLLDESGGFAGAFAVITDISSRKRAEEELNEYKDRLEELIGERTGELTSAIRELQREIAERRHAEAALLDSELQLRTTLDSMADAIHVADEDLRIVLMNKRFKEWNRSLGLPTDVIGKNLLEVFPFLPDIVREEYRRVFETGETLSSEETSEIAGETIITETWKIPVFEEGRVAQVTTIVRDITARHDAEQALRESEERYRTMFESMGNGVVIYEAPDGGGDFIVKDINSATERIEHVNRADIIGEKATRAFPGVRDCGILDVYRRVWNTGKSEHCPPFFYKDERVAGWRESFVYKLPSGEIVEIYDDVTDRKRAEDALRESEERYRSLAETARDFIFIVGRDDVIQYVNSAGAALFGAAPEAITGKKRSLLFPPTTSEMQQKYFDDCFYKGVHSSSETFYGFPNKEIWLDTSLVPLKNEEGEVTAVLGISRDITERKQLEQAKINFLGSISHELRTPLSLILGYSEMLLRENLPPSAKKKIGIIHDRGRQELKLVEELITLAKFESGEIHYEMAGVNLRSLLEKYLGETRLMIANIVQKRYRDAGFHFEKHISEDLKGAVVHCDEQRIKQVLDNLIENAVKYSEKDRLEFKVTAELEGGHVRIGVIDKGIGIPKNEQEKIFKPFYQVRTGRHPVSDGMGKGLSTVKETIEAHGGKVWVESEPGSGTAIYFTLPVKEFAEHAEPGAIRKILILDDEPDIAELVENLLASEGFEAAAAYSEKEALAILEEFKPDLILLDVQLPDADGLEFCRRLKSHERFGAVPVYLFSAKSKEDLTRMMAECGADGFVSKPFGIDSFLEIIENLLPRPE